MSRIPVLSLAWIATCAAAIAQTGTEPEPVLRSAPVVVEEPRLAADAAGLTRLQLEDAAPPSAQSLTNVFGRVANLHVNSGSSGSFGDMLVLRGLTNTPYFSDPAVTVYFDDLPLGSGFTYPASLFGFSNVAVFRGPQATVFGRAGEAGVVVFHSAEPGADASGEARVSYGNFDAYSGAVTARTARGQVADASVSAAYTSRDGYVRNTTINQRVDDSRNTSVAARVRVRPGRTSELTLQLLGNRLRNGAQPFVPLGGPLDTVQRGKEGDTSSDFGGVALKAAFDTDVGPLTATTSYTHWKLDPFTNEMVLPPPLDASLTQTQRTWNEEIRLSSGRGAATPWTVGGWFSNGRTAGTVHREVLVPIAIPMEASQFVAHQKTMAVFAEAVAMGDADWRITAGVRAEQVKKDFERTAQIPAPDHYRAERTFKALLPRVTASLRLTPATTASASLSVGTKPGGWSAYTAYPSLARFSAERTVALEGGFDTSFLRRTVTLAARAFTYSIRDYQIERSFTQADYIVVNAPKARSVGAEVEATWRPIPSLTFAATAGLAHVTLREFTDPFSQVNYSGKRAPYVPAYDTNLSATYRLAGWFATAEWVTAGKIYYEESENPAFAQRSRSLVNGRLGYETRRWRVDVFGDNLGNERYYSLINTGVGHGVPGAPRTYGVEAVVKW